MIWCSGAFLLRIAPAVKRAAQRGSERNPTSPCSFDAQHAMQCRCYHGTVMSSPAVRPVPMWYPYVPPRSRHDDALIKVYHAILAPGVSLCRQQAGSRQGYFTQRRVAA